MASSHFARRVSEASWVCVTSCPITIARAPLSPDVPMCRCADVPMCRCADVPPCGAARPPWIDSTSSVPGARGGRHPSKGGKWGGCCWRKRETPRRASAEEQACGVNAATHPNVSDGYVEPPGRLEHMNKPGCVSGGVRDEYAR